MNVQQHGKRKRRPAMHFVPEDTRNIEQKILQQAIVNSRKETKRTQTEIRGAPVFHPSVEEFKNPLAYIAKYAKYPMILLLGFIFISLLNYYSIHLLLLLLGSLLLQRHTEYAKSSPPPSGNRPV